MFKPGTASSGPYSTEFHCLALGQVSACKNCQYLSCLCEAVAADTQCMYFFHNYVQNTTISSGSFLGGKGNTNLYSNKECVCSVY